MPFGLNVRAVGQGKTHLAENLDRAIEHLRDRVERPNQQRRAGQGEVDPGERLGVAFGFERGFALVDRAAQGVAGFVEELADARLVVLGEGFHPFAQAGDAAGAPEVFDADGFKRRFIGRRREGRERFRAELFNLLVHVWKRTIQR